METVRDFIFTGSKITVDGDCSHEVKWCLLLGKKVITNLDSILKSRDITLPINIHLVKATVFPVIDGNNQTTWPASWETYMQVRKEQLELGMEQQTGSK